MVKEILCVGEDNFVACSVIDMTVLLKKFAGEEGEGVDVQKLFGYIGLFTLVALWWLGIIRYPPYCSVFTSVSTCESLTFNCLWFFSVAIDSIRDRTQVYHTALCQS